MLIIHKIFHPDEWTEEDTKWLLEDTTIELPYVESFQVRRANILWMFALLQIEMVILGYLIWIWRKIFIREG